MDVYCVKDRRVTKNVENTTKIVWTKNKRRMLKVKCAVCGITKTRFLPGNWRGPLAQRALESWAASLTPGLGCLSQKVSPFSQKNRRSRQILCIWGNERFCVTTESNKLWHEKSSPCEALFGRVHSLLAFGALRDEIVQWTNRIFLMVVWQNNGLHAFKQKELLTF